MISCIIDILDASAFACGRGVRISSSFASCMVSGTVGRSSAMPCNEFTEGSALLEVWDQTALRCSGSGGRDGLSLAFASR